MSFLLLIFNIFLNCNRKWGIIVKNGVVIGGKRTIIGGRRGIIGMIGMGVLVGMAQPSGNSVGVAFS